jgi:hypothetical protein
MKMPVKTAPAFVKWLYQRLPLNKVLPGTHYCTDGTDIGVVKAHYVMGTTGQQCSQWRLDYAYNKYYKTADYGSWTRAAFDAHTAGWIAEGSYLYDCEGMLDAFVGQDTNAAGCYVNWCGIKDEEALDYIMTNGEYAAGACVFKRNSAGRIYHVGFVAGVNGSGVPLIIEAQSFSTGIIMSTINDGWTDYGIPNHVLAFPQAGKTKFEVVSPMLQGEKIEQMQRALLANGYNPGTIDGKWGNNSQAAFNEMLSINRKPISISMTVNGENVVYLEK